MAIDADGDFVVAWRTASGQDGSVCGVFGQRFDAAGARAGSGVPRQRRPPRGDPDWSRPSRSTRHGDFVVVWTAVQDGDDFGVFAQRFDGDGRAAGRRVPGQHARPRSASSTAGRPRTPPATSWSPGTATARTATARRLRPAVQRRGQRPLGRRVPGEHLHHRRPDHAVRGRRTPSGGFVVVWDELRPGRERLGRLRRSASTPPARRWAAEFQVNTLHHRPPGRMPVGRARPRAATSSSSGPSFVAGRVAMRRLRRSASDAAGAPLGARVPGQHVHHGNQDCAHVAVGRARQLRRGLDAAGQDGDGYGVVRASASTPPARRAAPSSGSTPTRRRPVPCPRSRSDAAGNFVVAWNSSARTAAATASSAQRFGGLRRPRWPWTRSPARRDGNGVLEPGESVDVAARRGATSTGPRRPSPASLFSVTGPPGATYAITDPRRPTTARCADGATARVPRLLRASPSSDPAARPAAALGRHVAGDDRARRAGPATALGAARRRELHRRAARPTRSTASSRRCCTTA